MLDLGAIRHIIIKREYFISYKNSQKRISWGINISINSIKIGNVKLINKGNKIILENCLYIPNFKYNLIYISKLNQLSYKLRVKNNQAHI